MKFRRRNGIVKPSKEGKVQPGTVDSILEQPVLVLNRLWQPVHICTGRRAICLLFLEHAQVVHVDESQNYQTFDVEDWLVFSMDINEHQEKSLVHSMRMKILVPRILVLTLYDRIPRREPRFTRENIYQRDSYTCQYCSRKFSTVDLNLDHVVPRDKGGRSTWDNVVTSCISCNSRKGNKLPAQANMQLLKKPRAPRWRPFAGTLDNKAKGVLHDDWSHFMGTSNKNVIV